MFERAILHIGFGKTGTTSVQETAARNRARLARMGLVYPGTEVSHYLLGCGFCERPTVQRALMRKRVTSDVLARRGQKARSDIEAELSGASGRTLLLSCESFGVMRDAPLQALVAFARRHAQEVALLCYVRHPVSGMISGVQQRVRSGKLTLASFDPHGAKFRATRKLARITAAVPDVPLILRAFDRAGLYRGDTVSDVLHVAGLSDAELAEVEIVHSNESLCYEAVLLCDALNRGVPAEVDGAPNPARARQGLQGLSAMTGARFSFPPETLTALMARAQPELDRLQQRYGLRFPSPVAGSDGPLWGQATLDSLARHLNAIQLENEALKAEIRRLGQGEPARGTGQTRGKRRFLRMQGEG